MKKTLRVLLLPLMAMGLLISPAFGQTKLTMWVHVTDEGPEGQSYKARIDAWNKANPKDQVALEFIPRGGGGSGYEDKINTALTTKRLPDIITLDGPNTAAYAKSGIIAPIDQYVSADSKKDYLSSIIQQGTYNGKLYSLGIMESTVAIFYNKTLFSQYGLTAGTVDKPWTWDDLYNAGKAFTSKTGKPALDMTLNWTGEWKIYAYAPFFWSAGAKIVGTDGLTVKGVFNSPQAVEALSFIKKLVDDKISSKTPEDKGFMIGNVPMLLNGAWTVSDLETNYKDLDWGVMPFPVHPKTKSLQVPTGSWAFAVTSQSKNTALAAKVAEWMTNKESSMSIFDAISMLPNRKSAGDAIPEMKDGPYRVLYMQLAAGGHARPSSVAYPVISRAFEESIDAVLNGEDPKTTLDQKVAMIERETRRFK